MIINKHREVSMETDLMKYSALADGDDEGGDDDKGDAAEDENGGDDAADESEGGDAD